MTRRELLKRLRARARQARASGYHGIAYRLKLKAKTTAALAMEMGK